ncbi:maleylacetate reductase and hydroxyquinol 1,2-dioxygenase domain-containing protein [Cryptosporangium phraense]|uniref:Iron-containing alcohol dehydrogenase n=1 Tax=Cryptosporangium phraense TaxID=2593070 RepID=A0A545B044_9ACTN|nr:maleylacetate reductase and hydroxyquinol 1,2-dioxygenase domain-containing protein [Cryptosporangium phraense]TQS46929.1 iron-containing alcohol dehydrogenase [Cryptosporangium phraense]
MRGFIYAAHPVRVLFGAGTLADLRGEVERLGRQRALLVSGSSQPDVVARAAEGLGDLVAARFDGAAMHTPVEVTERALAAAGDVDCVVSIGGGSATGLGKAVAVRRGIPLVAVATTYAGSEVTPTLGETSDGVKTTRTEPGILPATVIYDVDLTLGMPVGLSVVSGVNAMAHAVEALYSADANPAVDAMAVQSITLLASGLRRIVAAPDDADARADALAGAWLAGTCLGAVGMGLHHKLCHTLGGSFGLPHAETHTVVLPHAMAYNAAAAPEAMARVATALAASRPGDGGADGPAFAGRSARGQDAAAMMYDFVVEVGGPTSLAELGLKRDDIPAAAKLATAKPYPNPREVTEDGIAGLLADALAGTRPAGAPDFSWLTEQVVASFAGTPDPRTKQLVTDLVRRLHAFAEDNDVTQDEWQYAIDFLTRTGEITSPTRQEFVLLSDTLGVSSMVDLLTNSRTPDTTPSAVLGPFYVPGPPPVAPGADISGSLPGTPLWVDVRIEGVNGEPIADATVDVWQSNEDGFYDLQLPDLDGPVLRGRLHSEADGHVRFWTILPSEYPIPVDGPVGAMLTATGRHPYRAPHLHFLIDAPGHRRLITQLFVDGGAYLDSDTVFGVKDDLIVDFGPGGGSRPDGKPGEWRELTYTFRIG